MAPSQLGPFATTTTIAPLLLLLLVFLAVRSTQAQLSLVNRPPGFVYNGQACDNAPVTVSIFIDNTCPDSQAALPIIKQAADQLGPQKVKLTTYLFPLPYHRNSHVIAKGAHVIDAYSKGKASYTWFNVIFDHLASLTGPATSHLNDEEVMDILAPLAKQASGIPHDQFRKEVQDTGVDIMTRRSWKYGCTRGVYGTPFYMVNDVIVEADQSWTVEQWVSLIESLLPS